MNKKRKRDGNDDFKLAHHGRENRPDVDMDALATLSPDELNIVLKVTAPTHNQREVIWRGDSCFFTRSDLKELMTKGMDLTNEAIDSMLCVLEERQKTENYPQEVICIPSFYSERIMIDQGNTMIEEWLAPKLQGQETGSLVIAQPLLVSEHWTLVVVNGLDKEILHYNSCSRELVPDEDPDNAVGVHECSAKDVGEFWRNCLKVNWPVRYLSETCERQIPGSNDYGVFLYYWIKCLMRKVNPTETKNPKTLHSIRGEMAITLLRDSRCCVEFK